MNFKKKVSGSWVDVPHYISGTDTETITTLPATIYPLAQTATIGLKGNTTQNGTPTPDNPVPVIGVGDLDNGNYKIPISSANTTTPVYLGEVQTTRKIKKLVLTGEEVYKKNYNESTNYLYYADRTIFSGSIGMTPVICNELPTRATAPIKVIGINTINPFPSVYFNFGEKIMNAQPSGNTVAGLKEYLAAQYAAGTPVTIWYILTTEETGIVNEPLMKIGDYADEVSGISIPVTAGGDTLSVDVTVQPSEVTVNYKGWHPVSAAHERESGAWT